LTTNEMRNTNPSVPIASQTINKTKIVTAPAINQIKKSARRHTTSNISSNGMTARKYIIFLPRLFKHGSCQNLA
ncbi:hypothetical protein, partial [Pseudoxanthobacter sp. M-2]|uniref:hypothetical protein n=1 Tax=Pseudoxanthobacter sp. M-2 TaxID=3078754 RepID=UPI0038FCBBBE